MTGRLREGLCPCFPPVKNLSDNRNIYNISICFLMGKIKNKNNGKYIFIKLKIYLLFILTIYYILIVYFDKIKNGAFMKIKINKAVVIIICVFLLHGDSSKENSRMAVFL